MNPRAAINDLLPFQGSPFSLLGTSPNKLTNKRYSISIPVDTAEKVGFEPTAPCGVTGFQDQLLKPLGHLSITVLLYQIGPIISNNVIVNQARKLAHSQLFSCIVSVESNFQLLLQHLRTSLFSTYQRWQWQSK